MGCPTFASLVDLVDDLLSPAERQEIEAHLAGGCPRCHETVVWLRHSIPRLGVANDASMPPQAVIERARGIFRPRRTAPQRERHTAFLRFDTSRQPLAAGVRHAGRSQRQLLYSLDNLDIDIQIERTTPQMWRIVGQVLPVRSAPDDVAGVRISLSSSSQAILDEAANQWGEFVIRDVPLGLYDLEISLRDRDIVVENLRVGSL